MCSRSLVARLTGRSRGSMRGIGLSHRRGNRGSGTPELEEWVRGRSEAGGATGRCPLVSRPEGRGLCGRPKWWLWRRTRMRCVRDSSGSWLILCLRVQTHHHQQVPKKSTFWVPPRFTIRDLLHEPRGDDDAFLTDESASISCCPGTLYRRGPLTGQTAKVGSTIEDCLCFSKVDFLGTSQVYHRTSSLRISLPKSLDPTQHHQSMYPKSRLFGYLPDLPSDVSSCMNPLTRWVLRPVGPQGAAHGLGYIQMPHVSAPGLVLNRSVSPGDPTHYHQGRYPKSRLRARPCAESIGFSRWPNPSPPKQVPKKSTFWLPPRFTIGPWSRVHSNATRIGARTCAESIGDPTHYHQGRYPKSRLRARPCAESIGFSRWPNPSPPKQVPKKSTFWLPPRFTIGRHLLHEPRDAEPFTP